MDSIHGQCRGHRDLHPFARAAHGGGVVRVLEFPGVLTSSGLVAFAIVSLLPVELILQVGSKAGFAMVFALLIAAIIWNLGTWYFGLPASSSHTLIGSVIGVGNRQPTDGGEDRHERLDWGRRSDWRVVATFPAHRLWRGCFAAAGFKSPAQEQEVYEAPAGNAPPPFYISALLVLTCTA